MVETTSISVGILEKQYCSVDWEFTHPDARPPPPTGRLWGREVMGSAPGGIRQRFVSRRGSLYNLASVMAITSPLNVAVAWLPCLNNMYHDRRRGLEAAADKPHQFERRGRSRAGAWWVVYCCDETRMLAYPSHAS